MGTMPHALIGYAGSTLRAAEMFHETFPDQPMTVLVDYFGREVTDALTVARRFAHLASQGKLVGAHRHAGQPLHRRARPLGLLCRAGPQRARRHPRLPQRDRAAPPGRCRRLAAAVWHLREALNREGFQKVKIVASSGFDPAKCKVMAEANAPIDIVGTGILPAATLDRDLRHRRHHRI